VIANQTKSHFETLVTEMAGKAELIEVIEKALEQRRLRQKKTILFVMNTLKLLNGLLANKWSLFCGSLCGVA
jgi:replication-associated recombination protein RarA